MRSLKIAASIAAVTVLSICVYTFLMGNEVFKGKFTNDGLAWYFLAKGIYCSFSLYLFVLILEVLKKKS